MYPTNINPLEMYELADDFANLDVVKWAAVTDGSTGTNTANGVAGGEVSVVTAAQANDYHIMKSTAQPFLVAAKKPLWFATRFTYLEANTSASGLVLGVSSVATGVIIVDTTFALAASFSGALFYKLAGSLALAFGTSNGSTQTKNTGIVTMVSGQVYQAGFHWDSGDGTTSYVTPWVYDETASIRYVGVTHKVLLASLAQMNLLYGVKSGGAAETIKLDYIRCAAKR
jgi:hypothetical protein